MRSLVLSSLSAALVLCASPAGASSPSSGWEIHRADRFCYAWLPAAEPGGANFSLAVGSDDRVTMLLSNPGWRLRAGRRYRLTASSDEVTKQARARAIRIRSDPETVAVAASVDPDLADAFLASPSLEFALAGPGLAQLSAATRLAGASAALAEVRRCAQALKGKRLAWAETKREHLRETFRSRSEEIWVRPTPGK